MLPSKVGAQLPQNSFSLFYYWHHIRKRLWLVILIVLIGVAVGAAQVARIRPLYRGSARVLVEQKMMSGSVVPFNDPYMAQRLRDSFHQTQFKLIKSRSLAREVIETLRLEQHPEFTSVNASPPPGMVQSLNTWAMPHVKMMTQYVTEKSEKFLALAPPTLQTWIGWTAEKDAPPSPASIATSPVPLEVPLTDHLSVQPIPNSQIAVTNAFLKRLKIQSDLTSNLISLRFEANDPKLAASVPNTLAQLYMNQVKNKRFEEAHEGIDWLKDRVEEMEGKVEDSEVELERYRQKHDTYSLDGQLPGVMQQLIAINSALTVVQTERINLEAVYQRIQKGVDGSGVLQDMIPGTDAGIMPELVNRLDELQIDLDQLQQKYGSEHPQVIKLQVVFRAQERKIDSERQRMIRAAKTRYDTMKAREAALTARYDELKLELQALNEKAIYYGRLKRNVESNQRLAKVLVDRLGETNLNMKVVGGTHFELVDPAEIPTVPINYRPVHTISMGGVVGLVIALGLAVGLGYLDDRLETPDDTQLLGFPVIGYITRHKALGAIKSQSEAGQLVMHGSSNSSTAEAYRMLRTNVLFSYTDPPRKVFLVTSSHPNEGKTTVSANLAFAMSQMELRVLLLEADLRNPSLRHIFDLDGTMGLSELLLKEDYDGCIHPYEGNLSIIPAGERPPNPSELLGSKRMRDFLAYARAHYDVVVVDSPPLLAVSDALMLSPLVDGILMVVRSKVTSSAHARRAISQLLTLHSDMPVPLNQAGMERPPINLGLVMNFLDPRGGQAYGYYGKYSSYYLNDDIVQESSS